MAAKREENAKRTPNFLWIRTSRHQAYHQGIKLSGANKTQLAVLGVHGRVELGREDELAVAAAPAALRGPNVRAAAVAAQLPARRIGVARCARP